MEERAREILEEKESALVTSLIKYYTSFAKREAVTWDQAMRDAGINPVDGPYCMEALPVIVGVPETANDALRYKDNLLRYYRLKSSPL